MAFPSNPTDGQSFTENNTVWIYSAATGQWYRSVISQVNETTYIGADGAPSGIGGDTQVIFNSNGSFAGDAGLVYNKTTDALTAGSLKVTSLGTAAAPSISVTGDPNTGIYSPGADQLALSTGGTGRLFVASDGKVGIGTSSPSAALHVVAPSGAGATNFIFAAPDNHVLSLQRVAPAANTGNLNFQVSTFGAGNIYADNTLTLQSGTNAALVFNTSGTTERARIDSSGRLLVGTSSARTNLYNGSNTNQFQVEGTNYQTSGASFTCNGGTNPTNCAVLGFNRSNGTTVSSNTLVASGDILGSVSFAGNDGTEFVEAASIITVVDGTPGTNDMPGRLVFSTTADGASSPTERMRISNDGAVKVAGDNFQIATSKTPASATAAGTVGQIAWDASYIYVCTATNTWKRAALSTW